MSEQARPQPIDPGERAVRVLRGLEGLKSDEPVATSGRDRLVARAIDLGFVCAVGFAAVVVAGAIALAASPDEDGSGPTAVEIDPSNPAAIATGIGVITAIVVVEIAMLARWGRTPGKRLMGLIVVDAETGQRPALRQAIVRTLAWGIPAALAIGFWWATAISWVFVLAVIGMWAWMFQDGQRRAAHDVVSGTRVLRPR